MGTITNRVQKLLDNAIIKGFQLELDYQKLGYNIEYIIELDANESIYDILTQYTDNIIAAHKMTGQYDIMLITRFKDIQALSISGKK